MNQFFKDKIVVITGASSGIGAELATELASRGARLALCARRIDQLSEVQKECQKHGVDAHVYTCDVTDVSAVQAAFSRIKQELGPIDILIANAGVSGLIKASKYNFELANQIIDVNVKGVMNAIGAVTPDMCARRQGAIVAVSSLASYVSIPKSYVYCASKSAVSALLQGLRRELRPLNIKVTTICPGYIRTEMTAKNTFKMPFLMDAKPAARRMADAIARGDLVYDFPLRLRWTIRLVSILPDRFLGMFI